MPELVDCRKCRYSTPAYHSLLCTVENLPKPIEYMRDDRSACGMKAVLFEPKDKKYAEYDE